MRQLREKVGTRERKKGLICVFMIIFYQFTLEVHTEALQVETNGKIGFTGVYELVGAKHLSIST